MIIYCICTYMYIYTVYIYIYMHDAHTYIRMYIGRYKGTIDSIKI